MRDSSPPRAPIAGETAAVSEVAEDLHAAIREEHAAGNLGATYAAAGDRAGVPKQHVGDWCNPLSGRTPKAHKIELLGARIALRFHRIRVARLEARLTEQTATRSTHDLRDVALGFQVIAGKYAERVRAALEDDHVDAAEDAALEAAEREVEAQIAASRAARAHRRARGGAR